MKLPRNIDGAELAEHLVREWDYVIVHQTGSHIVLRTQTPSGNTVVVPAHKPLKVGTFGNIPRAIAEHRKVSKQEIVNGL